MTLAQSAASFVNGDMNDAIHVYAGMSSSGVWRGKLNYLLKRDLDPAANDNSPAFLAQVG